MQKVSLEEIAPSVKETHDEALKASIFTEKMFLALFGAVFAVATSVQMWLQYETNKLAANAAIKTQEVAKVLDETKKINDEKLDGLEKLSKANHKLLNSDSLITKRLLAQVSRWKANETNDPNHVRAAEDAEKDVKESEAKQKEVNQK